MFRPLIATMVVVVLAAGTATLSTRQASAGFPSGGNGVRNWSPTFMEWPIRESRQEAIALAKRFEVVAATKGTFPENASAMHKANPRLKMLVYLNGAYELHDDGTARPNGWYARDSSGRKIIALGHPDTDGEDYLMNVHHPGWQDHIARTCIKFLRFSNYRDGCLLDSLGLAPFFDGYNSALPVDPRTGKVWEPARWMKDVSNLVRKVKNRAGNKLIVPNGINSGGEYFGRASLAPTKPLLKHADGAMVELFVRGPTNGLNEHRDESEWKKDVDMLADVDCSTPLFLTTKVWVSGTDTQKDSWHEYALATFLLGTRENSYFTFLYERDTFSGHPYWNVELGKPTQRYRKSDGVYTREFTRGRSLVNPTTEARTVSLGRSYTNLRGATVTSVVLPPHSGAVLRSSSSKGVPLHERCISARVSADATSGRLYMADGFDACTEGATVEIQRRRNGSWRSLERVRTRRDGTFRAPIGGKGTFRVVAPERRITTGGSPHDCSAARRTAN